jgi:hypothetical protein
MMVENTGGNAVQSKNQIEDDDENKDEATVESAFVGDLV